MRRVFRGAEIRPGQKWAQTIKLPAAQVAEAAATSGCGCADIELVWLLDTLHDGDTLPDSYIVAGNVATVVTSATATVGFVTAGQIVPGTLDITVTAELVGDPVLVFELLTTDTVMGWKINVTEYGVYTVSASGTCAGVAVSIPDLTLIYAAPDES